MKDLTNEISTKLVLTCPEPLQVSSSVKAKDTNDVESDEISEETSKQRTWGTIMLFYSIRMSQEQIIEAAMKFNNIGREEIGVKNQSNVLTMSNMFTNQAVYRHKSEPVEIWIPVYLYDYSTQDGTEDCLTPIEFKTIREAEMKLKEAVDCGDIHQGKYIVARRVKGLTCEVKHIRQVTIHED